MSKSIKKNTVWKNCKDNTIWAIVYRHNDTVQLTGLSTSVEGERRTLSVNNLLKKYKFDNVYKVLHGKYTPNQEDIYFYVAKQIL